MYIFNRNNYKPAFAHSVLGMGTLVSHYGQRAGGCCCSVNHLVPATEAEAFPADPPRVCVHMKLKAGTGKRPLKATSLLCASHPELLSGLVQEFQIHTTARSPENSPPLLHDAAASSDLLWPKPTSPGLHTAHRHTGLWVGGQ